jgi:hypothetical protein
MLVVEPDSGHAKIPLYTLDREVCILYTFLHVLHPVVEHLVELCLSSLQPIDRIICSCTGHHWNKGCNRERPDKDSLVVQSQH